MTGDRRGFLRLAAGASAGLGMLPAGLAAAGPLHRVPPHHLGIQLYTVSNSNECYARVAGSADVRISPHIQSPRAALRKLRAAPVNWIVHNPHGAR